MDNMNQKAKSQNQSLNMDIFISDHLSPSPLETLVHELLNPEVLELYDPNKLYVKCISA